MYYNLGVVNGILNVEALRIAQEKFGKQPLTGEQVRWGFEHLKLDDARLEELGALGLVQPLQLSCSDHEGGGAVRFQQWDGSQWKLISDWVQADRALLRPIIESLVAPVRQGKGHHAARLQPGAIICVRLFEENSMNPVPILQIDAD